MKLSLSVASIASWCSVIAVLSFQSTPNRSTNDASKINNSIINLNLKNLKTREIKILDKCTRDYVENCFTGETKTLGKVVAVRNQFAKVFKFNLKIYF